MRRQVFVFELRKRTAWFGTALFVAWTAVSAAPSDQHVRIIDLLQELIATGVDILYSSELVPPTLDAPPDAIPGSDPMSRVTAALAAHHLLLRRTGTRSYIVTVAPPPPTAHAAVPAAREVAQHEEALGEISVFADSYELTANAPGEPIGFDGRKLQQIPGGATDAVRVLRTAPGLATSVSARPYVRGAMIDDVLVEFDGIPLADPYHFKSFQSVMSVFNPATVSRADLFTGGFPVRFGTRSGGVLELVPRSIESGYEYSIGASLLSYDLGSVGRGREWPVEWLVSARRSGDHSALQPLTNDFGEPKFSDAVGRIRWTASSDSAITLGLILLDDQVQLNARPMVDHAAGRSRDLDSWLRWDWTPTASLRSRTSFAVANTERTSSGNLDLPELASGSLYAVRSFSNFSLRSEWAYSPPGGMTWNLGSEFSREDSELTFSRQELLAAPIALSFDRPQDATTSSTRDPRSAMAGLFASVQRRWGAFEAEGGLRLDSQSYQGFESRAQLSPRVNWRYDAGDRWQTYGSWGHFTQAQRVDEYRLEENQSTPDPASRAVHLLAGVTHEGAAALYWRLEAYRNHWTAVSPYFDNVLNSISLIPALEPDRVRVAPADAEAAGAELSAQRSLGLGFTALGIYSLSHVSDDVSGRDVPRSWDQRHAANLGMTWTHQRSVASALLRWHSGWPRTPLSVAPATPTQPAYLLVGARNSARWGNYLSADLRLSTAVPLRYGEMSLWFDASNVTNRSNDCCVDLNPMSSAMSAPAAVNRSWSPRIINVGFSWRVHRPQ
jgi:hypothetical protein